MGHMYRLSQYLYQRFRPRKELHLSMSILVKDEADIIEDNIRYHHKAGIDSFVVMDNGSTDGTREILENLKKAYKLHVIDQPDQNYQQSRWVTEMAAYCRDVFKADLVINNDADEFWEAQNDHSLKDLLYKKDSVVTVPRYNMALPEAACESSFKFSDTDLMVINPIDLSNEEPPVTEAMLFEYAAPKVIVNPHGLKQIKTGNHRASHVWGRINSRKAKDIIIYHYPIRSYCQFEKRIVIRKSLLQKKAVEMPKQYEKWASLYDKGLLKEEFSKFTLSENQTRLLKKLNIIKHRKPEFK